MLRAALILATALLIFAASSAPASAGAMPKPPEAVVIGAECPDPGYESFAIACAYPDGRIYLGPGANRFIAAHEFGHVFDYTAMTDGDRHWFARVLRLPGVGTWTVYKREVFADVYATCDLQLDREEDGTWPGGRSFPPTSEARMGRVCAAIERVGLRQAASRRGSA